MGKAKEDCGVEAVTGIDPAVASEVLNDMYFITKIFIIQSQISDKWLRDYYTKLAISSLSIVLHECLQAGLLNKQKSDREAVKLLRTIRHRMVKLVPKRSSDSIKSLMDTITMKHRIAARSSVDEEKNTSNFDQLTDYLEDTDNNWIDRINKILDE